MRDEVLILDSVTELLVKVMVLLLPEPSDRRGAANGKSNYKLVAVLNWEGCVALASRKKGGKKMGDLMSPLLVLASNCAT